VDFGDGVCRHPTQLYESAFHLTAAFVLYGLQRRQMFSGQLVKLYFVASNSRWRGGFAWLVAQRER
jgi:prolipoprotein diacylglyceryltransferase